MVTVAVAIAATACLALLCASTALGTLCLTETSYQLVEAGGIINSPILQTRRLRVQGHTLWGSRGQREPGTGGSRA